jgi:hypothetical protein
MGGFGSGRTPSRTKLEDYRALDINRMHKAGLLDEGRHSGWQWSVEGERQAWIQTLGAWDGLRLIYKARQAGYDWEDFDYRVPVEWVPCTFGGKRPYFRCPASRGGVACLRRVSKLYGGTVFACRHCHDLTYRSQSKDELGRLIDKTHRIRRKINPDSEPGFVPRPKGMWHSTYERLMDEYDRAEEDADTMLVLRFGSAFKLF